MLNDQTIIDNTNFRTDDDGKLYCYTNLPGGDKFEQKVSSKEAVQKNMIGWCRTVRDYLSIKEQRAEEERLARKRRKQSMGDGVTSSTTGSDPVSEGANPSPPAKEPVKSFNGSIKDMMIEYYHQMQDHRDQLKVDIAKMQEELDKAEEELQQVRPVMKAWNVENE